MEAVGSLSLSLTHTHTLIRTHASTISGAITELQKESKNF